MNKQPVIGFSGSRHTAPPFICSFLTSVPQEAEIVVGCAKGLDQSVRNFYTGRAKVFNVNDYGRGRSAYAKRSTALVDYLATTNGELYSFPHESCPEELLPSSNSKECFCGLGSGSWATLAYAIGLNIPIAMWLPPQVKPPQSWKILNYKGSGWYTNNLNHCYAIRLPILN